MTFWLIWILSFAISASITYSVPFGSSEEIVLVNQPVAITFSYPSAVLRFKPWNFQKYSKLEIRFNTRERRGILFFVGSSSSIHDCIGIDIFNSNVYVYGIINGKEFRVQMNPQEISVSDGRFYNIAIEMLQIGYLSMSFDGKPNPKLIQTPSVLTFETYTYIGGIDSTSRLPWISYSQVGFAGCIEYIRVNDDKFIDTNKFAKQTEAQGVKTGIAQTYDARCVPGLCDPGKCQERSFNLKDATRNFYCDCSGTFKTYSSLATDILRGEPCIRDSIPFQCDSKSFLFYDFDMEQLTHTDDISIDFKTTSMNEPLFFAKRKHGDNLSTFMSADVILGQVFVSMKLQESNDEKYKKVFIPPIVGLNDGLWHTLKITRYVQEVTVYVDNEVNIIKGELYRSSEGEKFYNKIREIYLGSKTAKPGNDKCTGTLKNFYWNEFDLLNTRNYLSRYQSQLISEKPQLPILPPFPRIPPSPCSIKPNHQSTVLPTITISPVNFMFMIELRTKYDGIVLYTEIPQRVDDWLTVLIIGNSVVVPYHLGDDKGLIDIELTRGGINIRDNSWHRIIIELSKVKSSITVFVDDVQDLTKEVINQNSLQNITELSFTIAGFSEVIQYYKVVNKLQEFSPILMNSFSDIQDLKFVGCLGEFLTNKESFSTNYLLQNNVNHVPLDSVFCRACQEVTKCPRNFCQNNGKCYNVNENTIACNCSQINFHGASCDIKNPTCTTVDCQNGGICSIVGGVKTCNCQGTGFTGMNCEVSRCTNFVCQNNGVCRLINGEPSCDCSSTTFSGVYCDQSQCPKDFCKNNAVCQLDKTTGLPFCDCKGTGYLGVRCDKPICSPKQCNENGNCVIRENKPFCYCFDDYIGENCDIPVCPKGYCLSGGRCTSSFKRPVCTCTGDFEGERCEKPKPCPQGSCFYGGSCKMVEGRPVCNCTNTDYFGTQCEKPKTCPDSYCQNKGKCIVIKNQFSCDCSNTGYIGNLCTNKLGCPDEFCFNNGKCSNENGKFVCDCSQTSYGGEKCDQQTKGIFCPYEKPGYHVKMFKPAKLTDGMTTSMGFQTWLPTGTIFCYQTLDDKYWSAKLMNGKVVIDINGMAFNMKTRVDDGKYHVIKVNRDTRMFLISLDVPVVETLTIPIHITNILSLPDNLIAYTKLILCNSCPDTDTENQFQGSVGGAKSGNDSIVDHPDSNSIAHIGPVTSVMVPMKVLPKRTDTTTCTSDFCQNGGICSIKGYRPNCDCKTSGYGGEKCDEKIYVLKSVPPNPGYVVHNIVPPIPKYFNLWRFISQLTTPTSPLATYILSDGNYLEFKYVNGKVLVVASGVPQGFLNNKNLDQNVTHFFKVQNMLGRLTMYINQTKTGAVNLPENFLMPNGSIKVLRIIVGANKNLDETIKGFIGGFKFDSKPLISPTGTFLPTSIPVRTIIVEPWIQHKKKSILPPRIDTGNHGGMVYKNGLSFFAIGFGTGAIVVTGTGPVILGPVVSLAGGVLPMSPMILGFIVAILLLISAFIWAICYLGLTRCQGSTAMFGMGVKGQTHSVMMAPLLEAQVTTLQSNGNGSMLKARNEQDLRMISSKQFRLDLNTANSGNLSNNNANLFTGGYQISGERGGMESASRIVTAQRGMMNGQALNGQMNQNQNMLLNTFDGRIQSSKSANLFSQPIYGMEATTTKSGYIFSQPNYGMEATTINAFSEDEMKVESCILSSDSRFAATGSVSGPPQIWDLNSGNLIGNMEGGDLTYTSLHLALNGDLLVGLMKENPNQPNIKLLTIWNFLTGKEMYLSDSYFCTECCISSDTVNCIMANETKESSISILNLRSRQCQNIFYHQPETLFNEGVQLLKISKNSKFIIAGCRIDKETSCYLVFDTLGSEIDEPKMIKIRSLLQSCSFINNVEMVIGTESGELIIWNLISAIAVRQILISSSTTNGIKEVLKPHENKINCIEVSKDGTLMVTGGSDTRVKVWDMSDETLIQNIKKHEDEIQSIALTKDNEILVTGSWDGSIRTWSTRTGQEMCSFTSSIEITKVLISEDKSVLVALGERSGVNKLVMLKIIRNISTIVRSSKGQGNVDGVPNLIVSPPL